MKVEFPNFPTIITKLFIFFISIIVLKYALDTNSLGLGIIALLINSIDIKLDLNN